MILCQCFCNAMQPLIPFQLYCWELNFQYDDGYLMKWWRNGSQCKNVCFWGVVWCNGVEAYDGFVGVLWSCFLTTWIVLVSSKSVKKASPWQYNHCPACWDDCSESFVNKVARPRDRVHDCMGVHEERCGKLPNVILTSCKWGSNSIQLKH